MILAGTIRTTVHAVRRTQCRVGLARVYATNIAWQDYSEGHPVF